MIPYSARAFSLLQLLVSIVVIAVVAACVLTGVNQAIRMAQQTRNAGNLRQIGVAVLAYAGDHRGETPPHISGGKKYCTIGVNLLSGSPPRKLFSATLPFGQGTSDYLSVPDIFYSPFASGMSSRRAGEFFLGSNGAPQIGYIFYYWSRSAENATTASYLDTYNDRVTESSRAPLYSDMLGDLATTHKFTSSRCAVLYLDGSIRTFSQTELTLPSWKARIQKMID